MILFSNARKALEVANDSWSKSKICPPDMIEANIRKTCFELQQCMEFFVKGLIELKGEQFIKAHPLQLNTNILINLISEGRIYFNKPSVLRAILDDINNDASKFNMWEASARYLNTFITTENEINSAFSICKKLENYCLTETITPPT
ncbi:MAG: HEPN domain-containing protein [Defluviitaleaceae bacterium]|nr:HEPN domain-containing protein [Defluviitaleaceae bacterium]